MLEKLKKEPALVISILVAVISLLTAFGVQITTDQSAAIQGFATAVLALIGGVAIRGQVTPTEVAEQDKIDAYVRGTQEMTHTPENLDTDIPEDPVHDAYGIDGDPEPEMDGDDPERNAYGL